MLPSLARSSVAALLLSAVAGCSAGGPVGATQVVAAGDAGARVALAGDELLTVALEARLSTGYSWQVDEIDPAVLRLVGREQESAALLGGVDREVLRFGGVAAGRTWLGLSYRRAWDPPGRGEQTYRVEVEVPGPYAGPYRAPALTARAVAFATPGSGAYPSSYNACASSSGAYRRCTPVKDQGPCGGCWAFATAGVFENLLYQADSTHLPDLSEQYLISCNREGWSCAGGWAAFDYYVNRWVAPPETQAGAVYEADFPYQASNSVCGSSSHPHHDRLASWGWAFAGTPPLAQRVVATKQAILDHGPVWTAVCTDHAFAAWSPSAGPFAGSADCTQVNHAVVLVGWDDNGGDGYWIMRNSWGSGWGDQGYMRIAWAANSIGDDVGYAVYQGANQAPLADAGADQAVDAGARVSLDGSGSRDPDGSIEGYAWVQTAGPPVTLAGADAALAQFTAPSVSQETVLGFELTVEDDRGALSSSATRVTVRPAGQTAQHAPGSGVSAGCGTPGSGPVAWALLLALLFVARRRASLTADRRPAKPGG